ncbi:Bacterial domain of uncharacterised function (DUF403) [Mycobacteroides abscessus subsp. massiliense]|nr:Bacterial domain of uncharacterised function (DUF403) [Mycobacteroides abscessus subsp. massiliense]
MHQLLEDASVDPDHASRVLLRVLGIDAPDTVLDVWSLTELVAFSRGVQGGSIVDSISEARENARGAREVTSTEMWECRAPPADLARMSSSPTWRGAPHSSRDLPTPHSAAMTVTGSWCWAAPSSGWI